MYVNARVRNVVHTFNTFSLSVFMLMPKYMYVFWLCKRSIPIFYDISWIKKKKKLISPHSYMSNSIPIWHLWNIPVDMMIFFSFVFFYSSPATRTKFIYIYMCVYVYVHTWYFNVYTHMYAFGFIFQSDFYLKSHRKMESVGENNCCSSLPRKNKKRQCGNVMLFVVLWETWFGVMHEV